MALLLCCCAAVICRAHAHVNRQRSVRRHEDIQSQIELLPTNQLRVLNVSLDDVRRRLGLVGAAGLPRCILLPVVDLRELVEEEDALALSGAGRLHDPDGAGRVVLELLDEEAVVGRQHVRAREEVVLGRLV